MLGDFFYDIYSTDALDERFKIFEKYVQTLGFEGVSYTFMPEFYLKDDYQQAPAFMSSELFPRSFIEQYTDDRFDKNDFTVRRIKSKQLRPMDWQMCGRSDELSQEEKNVITTADHEHGIKNAISIPTMSKEVGIAGASIISTVSNTDFQKLKDEKLETLRLCTRFFHDSTQNQSTSRPARIFVLPLLTTLNPKEIYILRYLATGQSLKNISFTTDIVTYNYAKNVLHELRKKFGGISKDKLMYIIGLFNILENF